MTVRFENIPKRIAEKNLFCLAKLEQNPNKEKPDKIPYQIKGTRASPNNEKHFSALSDVKSVFEKGGYDGIGIGVFDDLTVIDIDNCVINGKLRKFAQKIVNKLKCYTEISVSGKGIHILTFTEDLNFDKNRYYFNNRRLGLEIYPAGFTKRFIMLTGNVINKHGINERTKAIQEILEKYMLKPCHTQSADTVSAPGSCLSDEAVLEKMFSAGNGAKAESLWNGGNDGKSASEGDLALCNILAFWCGGDKEQMDRLFRISKRMRGKWDEVHGADTYGGMTIQKAILSCCEFYKPVVHVAAEDFNDLVAVLVDLAPESNPRYKNGDLGKGRLFADIFKNIARYVPERKKWYVYDGSRWIPDIGSLKVMELAKDLADAITVYSTTITDEYVRELFTDTFVKRWIQRGTRSTYINDAESVYPVSMKQFDSDICLFNVQNGTLDLRERTFREHQADDFITKLAPVHYEPSARSERFLQFIEEITSHDIPKALYLQKALGYSLTGDTRYECMFFLYGETTRNGKGTLMESILLVLGDYGLSVRPETIAMRPSNSQSPSEDIARLAGIRFANISEPSRGLLLNAAQIKSMTGNDTLNARFLHENSFDFKPQFKLYVNTNYLPVITDMTVFTSNRVLIIPFDRHFEEWEQDKGLKSEFRKPEVQSAILNWLIEGYHLLRQKGFIAPPSVVKATTEYSHESDKISQFAEDRLIADDSAEIRTSVVYDHYKSWCDANGCFSENSRNFNQELRKFGTVVRKRPKTGGEKTTLLLGYRMKDVFEDFLQ